MKKRLTENIKMIILIVVVLTAYSGGLYKVWSMDAKVNTGLIKVASLSDEVRKMRIYDEKKDVEDRMWWLESKYGIEAKEGNEGNQTEYKELKIKFDCLRNARHDKDKTYKDCDVQ